MERLPEVAAAEAAAAAAKKTLGGGGTDEQDNSDDDISRVSSSLDEIGTPMEAVKGRGGREDGLSANGVVSSFSSRVGSASAPSASKALLLSVDARLLAVMSNASVMRAKVLPSLVELHRPLLVGRAGKDGRGGGVGF